METRGTYLWNAFSYVLYAFQSAIMMFGISHGCSISDSGIFSVGYAIANLFLCIANFSTRNFQISDIKRDYTFNEYRLSRVITICISFVAYLIYSLLCYGKNGYTLYKIKIFTLIFLMKIVEAGEDVYHGYYQMNNRLIDAARLLSYRLLTTYIFFSALIMITNNLIQSLYLCVIYTIIFAILSNKIVLKKRYKLHMDRPDFKKSIKLLWACLPLCISQCLLLYIANAPKYVMNHIVSDEFQAYYGYLSLPIFAITLFSNIVYVPKLTYFASVWKEGHVKLFVLEILKRCMFIVLIAIIAVILGDFIGLKLLSLIYGVNLQEYDLVFSFLIIGGGFSAICAALNYFITVIGEQRLIVVIYFLIAIFVLICSETFIRNNGILGAAVLMMTSYGILSLILFLVLIFKILWKSKREKEDGYEVC